MHYKYLEDYWIQSRVSRDTAGMYTSQDRITIKLQKFHQENDWALFTRVDSNEFDVSERAVIDESLLTDPRKVLVFSDVIVLHCPVSLVQGVKRAEEFSIGCQMARVTIQTQSTHHLKYNGNQLCRGSSGGGIFVYPSNLLIGMHSEAILESDYDEDVNAMQNITDSSKRVKSEDNPYEEIVQNGPQKKIKSDSETVASLAGGNNGLGSGLIICQFPRLMVYIRRLDV
jgi:hypothetical protein